MVCCVTSGKTKLREIAKPGSSGNMDTVDHVKHLWK